MYLKVKQREGVEKDIRSVVDLIPCQASVTAHITMVYDSIFFQHEGDANGLRVYHLPNYFSKKCKTKKKHAKYVKKHMNIFKLCVHFKHCAYLSSIEIDAPTAEPSFIGMLTHLM